MECQVCNKKPATVHITDVLEVSLNDGVAHTLQEKHVCEACAQVMNLPHMPAVKKNMLSIWKLLQQTQQKARLESGLRCPECGMTLAEFRGKGRLGCARDYEIFREHLDPLLQRIHNSVDHVGRLPGLGDDEIDRMKHINELRHRLDEAIREEAYEDAARLRDELQALEGKPSG